ncbi:MAG: ABC transporter substrate-binding protein, partial [Actinomycetota bacterium]|nr:ABC transporter substrate-binding protein [Actinomycetota bacterium]
MAVGAVGCSDPLPGLGSSPELEIVAQVEIGADGAEIPAGEQGPPADPAGDGNAVCPPLSIAMAGPLEGPDSALGVDIKNGIQLAVDKHNAANQACQVQLKPFDTQNDPQRAADLAGEIVDDAYTVGLVGPAGSGEAFAVGDQFSS